MDWCDSRKLVTVTKPSCIIVLLRVFTSVVMMVMLALLTRGTSVWYRECIKIM